MENDELTPVELPKVIETAKVDSEQESAQTDGQAETDTESGELEVSIEGDSPPPEEEQDSSVIREMRKALREKEKAEKAASRRAKELEAQLEAIRNPKRELGPKPTLDQFDYDADAFESALLKWADDKRKADAELAKQQEAQKAEQQSYAERLERYQAEKRDLRIANIDEAETAVRDTLNVTQQSVLVRYFDRPAVLVAAIGSNPETAKKLAAITDPIEFAFAVRDLESKVKTTPRKPPPPAPSLATTRTMPSGNREQLLLKAATESGDYTELHRYRQEQRKRA